jgi:hypothetical protein
MDDIRLLVGARCHIGLGATCSIVFPFNTSREEED